MQENFESKIEKKSEKTATDTHLEFLNPQLWRELSDLSEEEQDKRWFELTQKHLKSYEQGDTEKEEFKSEELEFIFLNRLGIKNMPTLKPESVQRGFFFNPENQPKQKMEKFGNFGNFIATVQSEAEKHIKEKSDSFQVLIGGIGISGKGATRDVLTKELIEKLPEQKIISINRDYQKLSPIPTEWQGDINLIEDIHALDEEQKNNLIDHYNMIVYVLPTAKIYKQNLINRGIGWLRMGKLDLTAPNEKQYTGDQKQKIKQTADELEKILPEAQIWFKEQLRVLKEFKNKGMKIAVIEPSEILKQLYGLEENPELTDKSFAEALEMIL